MGKYRKSGLHPTYVACEGVGKYRESGLHPTCVACEGDPHPTCVACETDLHPTCVTKACAACHRAEGCFFFKSSPHHDILSGKNIIFIEILKLKMKKIKNCANSLTCPRYCPSSWSASTCGVSQLVECPSLWSVPTRGVSQPVECPYSWSAPAQRPVTLWSA